MNNVKTKKSQVPAEIKLATCWRILHMMISNYGSRSMGQMVTALTINILHRSGYSPTFGEICDATGFPTSNVSRYVNRQLRQGYLQEIIDPNDRRTRRLQQTERGRAELKWLISQLDIVWDDVGERARRVSGGQTHIDPQKILDRMADLSDSAESRP
jgi:DNA-binding MarR family transcriptional regulator